MATPSKGEFVDDRPRGRRRSDLRARVLVAIPAGLALLGIVIAGGWVFTGGLILVALIAAHELYRLYDAYRPIRLAGFLGVVAMLVIAQLAGRPQLLLALLIFIPVVFVMAIVLPRSAETPVTFGVAITLLGVVWIGVALAHAVLLRRLPHGSAILINVLVATFFGDTAAYLGGRAFGRHALAPRISPNKTIEGTVLGILGAIFAAWAAGLYEDWLNVGQALLIGVGVAIAAPLGDLFESQIKRDVDVKDTGSVFGAHGGALDRIDALLFSVVVGYYIWLLML